MTGCGGSDRSCGIVSSSIADVRPVAAFLIAPLARHCSNALASASRTIGRAVWKDRDQRRVASIVPQAREKSRIILRAFCDVVESAHVGKAIF